MKFIVRERKSRDIKLSLLAIFSQAILLGILELLNQLPGITAGVWSISIEFALLLAPAFT